MNDHDWEKMGHESIWRTMTVLKIQKKSDVWICRRCGSFAISEVDKLPLEGDDNVKGVLATIRVPPCHIMMTRSILEF